MKIIKSFRKTLTLKVDRTWELIIKAPYFTTKRRIEDFIKKHKDWIEKRVEVARNRKSLTKWEILELKKNAKDYIPKRVELLALKYSLKYNLVKITSAKTRWGSCTSKKNLNFTYRLMLAPEEVIDYVIIHELAHLKHMNHSKKFWEEVWKMMVDYKKHEKWLKIEWIKLN